MMNDFLNHVRKRRAELLVALAIAIFAYMLFITGFLLQSHGMSFP